MQVDIFRPQTFEEYKGQSLIKEAIKSIALKPEKAPRSIILAGQYGTGKTTIARLFAKALNCSHYQQTRKDVCGSCPACKGIALGNSPYYIEYDSAIIGSVDTIRELRDILSFSAIKGYRVITLDEAHLLSKAAQSALLKILEEAPSSVFFVFPTTDVQKLLPTIRSRSLEFTLQLLKPDELESVIQDKLKLLNLQISPDTLSVIVRRSRGHARDAVNLLRLLSIVGEEKFLSLSSHPLELLSQWVSLILSPQVSKDQMESILHQLISYPCAQLKEFVDEFFKLLADYAYLSKSFPYSIPSLTPQKAERLCLYYLRNRHLLSSDSSLAVDWYLFFLSATKLFQPKPQQQSSVLSRFSKQQRQGAANVSNL